VIIIKVPPLMPQLKLEANEYSPTQPLRRANMAKLTQRQILEKVAAGEITPAEAERLNQRDLRVQVNPPKEGKAEGTISVYGLQRFPVSLYPSQWDRLLHDDDKDGVPVLEVLTAAVTEALNTEDTPADEAAAA
jgi:hypothetical protein